MDVLHVSSAKKCKMNECESDEVYLCTEGKLHMASKEMLRCYSEYFRAMFSGNYREAHEHIIEIEIVDALSMEKVLNFMKTSEVELKHLQEASILFSAATYLQIDKLIARIEDYFINEINVDTWLQIMDIAQDANARYLQQRAAAFGLYNVRQVSENMQYFSNITRLQWYLSHTHLIPENEQQVFEMGADWIEKQENAHPDAILVVIGSLNINHLTCEELNCIDRHPLTKKCKRASDIISCLRELAVLANDICGTVNMTALADKEVYILNNYSREIYEDVKRLVEVSVNRVEVCVPCIAAFEFSDATKRCEPDHLYCYSGPELGLERLAQVASKCLWGWVWAPWGSHRAVVVGGEYARGSGRFENSVRVYDTLSGAWTDHKVSLPACRHPGTVVLGNTLYIVGGVGKYRVVLSSAIAYDLKERTYMKLPDLPEKIQRPAIVTHKGNVYVAGQVNVYILRSGWEVAVALSMRADLLISIRGQLYATQADSTKLVRLTTSAESPACCDNVKCYKKSVSALCYTGIRLTAFMMDQLEKKSYVECSNGRIWCGSIRSLGLCGSAGCGPLALSLPPVQPTQQAIFAVQCIQGMHQT